MTDIVITVPDAQAAKLTAQYGDLTQWLRGIALAEYRGDNRRLTMRALKVLTPDDQFCTAVADLVRGNATWLAKIS